MKRPSQLGILILLLLWSPALALRWGGRTKEPMPGGNWPAGSKELANLSSRIGYQGSDPGREEFYYQGDSAACQAAIDKFAAIQSPNLQLIIQDGPYKLPGGGWSPPDMAGDTPDWVFTIIDAATWNRWAEHMPQIAAMGGVPAPKMVVYIGGREVDWSKLKMPANVQVSDERADAAGFKNGPVVQADIYDITTSKPIPGARLAIGTLGPQNAWTLVEQVTADANGHALMKEFIRGNFRVAAFGDNYTPRAVEYVEFRSNTFKRYSIYLAPATVASGNIVDDDGKPLAGVSVRAALLLAPDGKEYTTPDLPTNFTSTTDEKGAFSLIGLPQGTFQLYATSTTHFQTERLKALTTPKSDIVVKMARTGAISGKVLDQQGQPIGKGLVRVSVLGVDVAGTWAGSKQLNPDGTFQFDKVPPGRYVIANGPPPLGLQPTGKLTEVDVRAGETVEVIVHW